MFALTLLACGASPDQHRTTPGAKATSSTAAAEEEDGTVCREESVTGSNMTRTVCRTPEERERNRKDAQDFNTRSGRIKQTMKGN